ncbi:unnamed protein product [Rotaria sordida]|uniref:Uncharacterized protein n=1 Tax=Rotaria sordida TaxID=392033 RepID=A0A814AVN4_9BILA|nr:unnamed protein product [Rotaria sordida]CAF0955727.1 unnamed protein product [Rotaria sordida]
MTQQKIDDLFSLSSSSSTRSSKRSRINQIIPRNNRDEFDDLFETNTPTKRRCTNNNNKQLTDVFDFNEPSTSTSSTIKKNDNKNLIESRKIKRNIIDVDNENKAIDELFNNDTRKKIRRQIKHEESTDLLDMFKTKTTTNISQTISSNIDDFKIPIHSKNLITQKKKIKMFFDDSDLISLREQVKQQNDIKDYVQVKPVLVTGGEWLSKETETKTTCKTIEPSNNPTTSNDIPDDQRNLMHIQYVPLIMDDQYGSSNKKSKSSKNKSVIEKSNKKILDGKSFHKQLVLSDSTIVRKENLQSCYNALLEDLNKPRIPSTSSSSSNKQKKSTTSKNSHNNEIILSDEEQIDNIDFFDLPTRKKKF